MQSVIQFGFPCNPLDMLALQIIPSYSFTEFIALKISTMKLSTKRIMTAE